MAAPTRVGIWRLVFELALPADHEVAKRSAPLRKTGWRDRARNNLGQLICESPCGIANGSKGGIANVIAGAVTYRLLFPGLRDPANTPMSAETINKALKILGFEGEQTGHGFRGLASTIMNERSGTRPEVIERQLAHKERNMVRRAYNHAEYLDERRQLMQWWSDYLDRCVAKAEK
ncbi:tyrosine-type recombinase/integrase [Achromobacter xylosoxidans]